MFIQADKYMNLKTNVLKISADIIKIFLNKKSIPYSELQNIFYSLYGDDYNYILIPALNFLYLMGKLKYIPKTDKLELIK